MALRFAGAVREGGSVHESLSGASSRGSVRADRLAVALAATVNSPNNWKARVIGKRRDQLLHATLGDRAADCRISSRTSSTCCSI
jgi:hypothetical protein